MSREHADEIVAQYERGELSRRQLAARLMGLGAALAAVRPASGAARADEGLFRATGLDHVALNVRDVARSRDFYVKHLGLEVIRDGGASNCFLGSKGKFYLTLFRGNTPGLNHYSYAIEDYEPGRCEAKLRAAGLKVRREGGRLYFPDPDGIEVQISALGGE